ncbi:MAG: permease-like cell division protein FtsX [Desulfobacterales bacterium]|nr:permease-like cell division protein FtsX [Desulfobacterales bacterium]
MKFLTHVLTQTGRNLQKTWATQLMTLLTVSLSVLIFAFFFLIYTNVIKAGERLGDHLRLTIYLDEEPGPEMRVLLTKKITDFNEVEKIKFTSRAQAFKRLSTQLGDDQEVLADMDPSFLPPSIEIYPKKDLNSLARIKAFSDYLETLPGATKVQYGHGWVERFHYFTKLVRVIVLLSGILLILTTTFMVAYTIRLAVMNRQAELEILRLLGATNSYIRAPFLLEGLLQGLLGSALGIFLLLMLFRWIKMLFTGEGFLNLFEFSFFPPLTTGIIMAASILLCTVGSLSAMRKFMRI